VVARLHTHDEVIILVLQRAEFVSD